MDTNISGLAPNAAYDVVVIGAGGAGMAAALLASIKGLSVLLVERTEYVGGTTALSGGTTWVPNTRHGAGSDDSPEKAAHFLNQAVGNHSSAAMRQAFLDNGPAAIATLEDNSEVRFRPYAAHPDYMQEVEGATIRGRALEPVPFDGRRLGDSFSLLRPPIPEFTVLGGMMVDRTDINHLLNLTRRAASLRHSLKLLLRHATDRIFYPRGTRLVMGNALTGRLLYAVRARGVKLVTRTEMDSLRRDAVGAVNGVVLRQGDVVREVAVRRGVVLASGGFSRNAELRAAWLHAPLAQFSPSAPGHTGAAHAPARAVGAAYGPASRDSAFWAPVSVRKRADGSDAVFPHFVLDRSKPGTVCVNASGRRFVNETISYHEFVRAMYEAHKTVPSIPTFLICDAVALRKYGLGMVRPGGRGLAPFLEDGYLTQAQDIPELAARLGLDAAALGETIAGMNAYAVSGEDPDFHRGSTPYQRHNGDAAHGPNPTLGPIATAPFYAVRLYPGDIGAARGFAADTQARVLDADERPIPGLYACGNDMQSIMGGTYPGPGITIGPGLTFAYIAVNSMASRVV
ncbi:MAG: FAD-dependent oxidoreductase [Rhodospirillales bacterium]|nr:FAD-dependent oxidoreductase [Rhodospirillales bacterium]